ncbi:hypothetical protein GQX73_g232 [Xylaria multiplex]|uniref:Uncharacterized protein n=1 Tax=Xylaria multiplex TaxID=323545 RepID=A0A7C8IVJ6_9PEZI|nr:hypothetical protein GQX73_g232 [Xylaria multiplex]
MPTHKHSKKTRRCCLKPQALVYDTTVDSYTIKADDKIKENYEDYWSFKLGPPETRTDSWDLFLNEKADCAIAVGQDRPPKDAIFIAGLQLSNLGVWGKILRKTGALNNGYIKRPESSSSTKG